MPSDQILEQVGRTRHPVASCLIKSSKVGLAVIAIMLSACASVGDAVSYAGNVAVQALEAIAEPSPAEIPRDSKTIEQPSPTSESRPPIDASEASYKPEQSGGSMTEREQEVGRLEHFPSFAIPLEGYEYALEWIDIGNDVAGSPLVLPLGAYFRNLFDVQISDDAPSEASIELSSCVVDANGRVAVLLYDLKKHSVWLAIIDVDGRCAIARLSENPLVQYSEGKFLELTEGNWNKAEQITIRSSGDGLFLIDLDGAGGVYSGGGRCGTMAVTVGKPAIIYPHVKLRHFGHNGFVAEKRQSSDSALYVGIRGVSDVVKINPGDSIKGLPEAIKVAQMNPSVLDAACGSFLISLDFRGPGIPQNLRMPLLINRSGVLALGLESGPYAESKGYTRPSFSIMRILSEDKVAMAISGVVREFSGASFQNAKDVTDATSGVAMTKIHHRRPDSTRLVMSSGTGSSPKDPIEYHISGCGVGSSPMPSINGESEREKFERISAIQGTLSIQGERPKPRAQSAPGSGIVERRKLSVTLEGRRYVYSSLDKASSQWGAKIKNARLLCVGGTTSVWQVDFPGKVGYYDAGRGIVVAISQR